MLGGIFGGGRPSPFDPNSSLAWDPQTQQAVNQYAPMSQQPAQQQGPSKLQRWGSMFQGVGAALRDDPAISQQFQDREGRQQQFQQRQQQEQTDYARRIEDERNNWLFQQDYERKNPKPTPPTEMQRNFEAYQGMDDPHKQQFGAYQDLVNPRYTQGPSGTMFIPRTAPGGLPSGYDPKQWEVVDGPQSAPQQDTATPSGSPLQQPPMSQGYQGPSPEQMHQLYRQQFGARGDAMFQEWLRNSQGGR